MRYLILCVGLFLLQFTSGCSTTLKPRQLEAGGKFSTSCQLDDGGVIVAKPFSEKFKALAYVRTGAHEDSKYMKFWIESIRNMGVFTRVARKSEIESFVIERKLTGKVSNISDLIGLHQLSEQIGPFLVVEPVLSFLGGYNYTANLKAIDPETGETVLHLQQKALNWSGLDDPLFYPLLNGFVQWTRGETITTKSLK